jgi:hypothetical protein
MVDPDVARAAPPDARADQDAVKDGARVAPHAAKAVRVAAQRAKAAPKALRPVAKAPKAAATP